MNDNKSAASDDADDVKILPKTEPVKETPSVVQPTPVKLKDLPVQQTPQSPIKTVQQIKTVPPVGSVPKIAPGTALSTPVAAKVPVFDGDFKVLVERAKASGNELTIGIVTFMEAYLKDMAPDSEISDVKIDPLNRDLTKKLGARAAQRQLQFYKAIMNVIDSSSAEDFRRNWILILSYFYRYKTEAFGERYVNRFAEYWDSDDDRLVGYQRLINLILLSANPAERALTIQRVNLAKTMEIGFTETGRNNIGQFYAVAVQ